MSRFSNTIAAASLSSSDDTTLLEKHSYMYIYYAYTHMYIYNIYTYGVTLYAFSFLNVTIYKFNEFSTDCLLKIKK